MSGTPALSDRGLQAERTALSWSRTSFAFLVNGALLMIRNLHGSTGPAGWIPAGLAGAVALLTYYISRRRQRILRQPVSTRITARRSVYSIGVASLLLIVVTTIGQLLH
ncbi:DUF202 domain-containing protein [Mycobacterium sp. Lab-001]|uniref:DUF202 domain-containing protein n=1 Tax=Mycobacterium sp. Lab-001 TaxID=3410136 RepID=UPI003D175BD1